MSSITAVSAWVCRLRARAVANAGESDTHSILSYEQACTLAGSMLGSVAAHNSRSPNDASASSGFHSSRKAAAVVAVPSTSRMRTEVVRGCHFGRPERAPLIHRDSARATDFFVALPERLDLWLPRFDAIRASFRAASAPGFHPAALLRQPGPRYLICQGAHVKPQPVLLSTA